MAVRRKTKLQGRQVPPTDKINWLDLLKKLLELLKTNGTIEFELPPPIGRIRARASSLVLLALIAFVGLVFLAPYALQAIAALRI